jgi:hypothetical protein
MIISSAVYKTQCKTFLIAQELAGQFNNVSSINDSLKPPYCLRVVKKYRTAAMQQFRDIVAQNIKLKVKLK